MTSVPLHAQDVSGGVVTGRVVEAASGSPLPGANVVVEGADVGAATDRQGRFRLVGVAAGERTLVVSFIGYRPARTTVEVVRGATVDADVELESEVLQSGEVVVQGLRGEQLRALSQKRQALNLVEVLSADAIGKLPDQNVAEAVRRVPGVTIQTDRGEGRFVSIRGAEPNLSNVTLNGQALASSAESRATALDLLPSDMVSSIEVTKAVTPDMDGNAVGGAININTLTAFDRSGPFAFGSVTGALHEQQVAYGRERLPYQANLTAGTRLGAGDAWGVVVSGSASRRDYTASVSNPTDWEPFSDAFVPEEFENEIEETRRARYGVSANVDYRPTDRTGLYLRTSYARTDEFDDNAEYQFELAEGDLSEQTAMTGRFSEGAGNLDLALTEEDEYLVSATLGGEQRFGALTWTADGTYTRGFLDRYTRKPEFTTGDREDFASAYDVSGDAFELDFENASAVNDPANYVYDEIDLEFESNTEDTWVASTDLRWDTRLGGAAGFFQAGGKFRTRNKVIDDFELGYIGGTDPATLALGALTPPGLAQDGSRLPVLGDTQALYEFFREHEDDPRFFELDDPESEVEGVENDSDNQEDVYAGYVMGSAAWGALTVLAGVRVERTRTESTRWQLLVNEDTEEQGVESQTFTNAYTSVLPSVHFKYNPAESLVLRAAWTNTIGRPDYEELAGFREVEFRENEPGVFEGAIEEGNPELKPFRAMNLDAVAEYYLSGGGLLSLGGFYKRIDDPIYEFDLTERDVTRTLGGQERFFEEIGFRQDRNADAGTVRGLEASYQQLLLFLPAPLNGLGLAANVAVIDSGVDVPGREGDDLPFFGQSDRVYNVIPYFQRAGFELRMALSYQSAYLDEVGEEAYLDAYADDRLTIDLTASYAFLGDRLEATAQVRNLTNEAERAYQSVRSRYIQNVLTGRTFTLGLSASF